jgi:hypothetical protein
MRAPAVTVGALILAMPASAFALSEASKAAPSPSGPAVQVDHFRGRVAYGKRLVVRGQAPAADAGQRLALEFEPAGSGSWRTLATSRADAAGHFTLRASMRRSGLLRVASDAAPSTASAADTSSRLATATASQPVAASSRPERIRVAAGFRIGTPHRDAVAGRRITVRGRLLPAGRGRLVRLVTRSHRGWRTLATARTGARGGFSIRYAVPAGQTRWLRVSFGGDRTNQASSVRAGNVTGLMYRVASWYNDGGQTACGFHATYGVANKTLPCGTKVTIAHAGRSVVATVDDRGPFVPGRDYDLNQNTAAALDMYGVATVLASR